MLHGDLIFRKHFCLDLQIDLFELDGKSKVRKSKLRLLMAITHLLFICSSVHLWDRDLMNMHMQSTDEQKQIYKEQTI